MLRSLVLAIAGLCAGSAVSADTIEMKVNGLVCSFCAQGIEKALRRNPATQEVLVSLENRLVAVTTRPGQDIGDPELKKALQDAGYDVRSIARTPRTIDAIRSELARAR